MTTNLQRERKMRRIVQREDVQRKVEALKRTLEEADVEERRLE